MAQLLLLGPNSHRNRGNRGRFTGSSTAETRTPNLHRANIAHQRVRMEGWRQRRLGSKEDHSTTKGNYKTDLTLTGLLMEGLGRRFFRKPRSLAVAWLSIFQLLDELQKYEHWRNVLRNH